MGAGEGSLAEAQHVHHVVEPGRLANDPSRGTQGPAGEGVSTAGTVRHFDPFPHPTE